MLPPLEGRLKVWRFETRVDPQGSTIQTSQIEASRVSYLFINIFQVQEKIRKIGGRVEITPLLYPLSRGPTCNNAVTLQYKFSFLQLCRCYLQLQFVLCMIKISNKTLNCELWKNLKCDVTWSLPPPPPCHKLSHFLRPPPPLERDILYGRPQGRKICRIIID